MPALGVVVGGVMTSAGTAFTVTVTEPEAWPELLVPPLVPVPVVVPVPVPVVPVPLVPVPELFEDPPRAPTLAVTVACWLVVSTVLATPLASVVTTVVVNAPAVVVKTTGTLASALPLMSNTFAVTVVEPPFDETDAGLAVRRTAPTAALPTEILRAPFADVFAPPDVAPMTALPFALPGKNLTIARPLTSVVVVAGCNVPRLVVKVMDVPLCGGLPDASSTWATTSTDWPGDKTFVELVSIIDEPVGASSGTFSQETATATRSAEQARSERRQRANIGA